MRYRSNQKSIYHLILVAWYSYLNDYISFLNLPMTVIEICISNYVNNTLRDIFIFIFFIYLLYKHLFLVSFVEKYFIPLSYFPGFYHIMFPIWLISISFSGLNFLFECRHTSIPININHAQHSTTKEWFSANFM